ncbi:MAG TPA: OmpW family outer membrane protein [Burkholderiaceae bacterium]|nr:OmpW family outer membrane protein [Burkholderiaceae bacterium]
MARLHNFPPLTAALCGMMALLASPGARAADTPYSIAIGYARAHFNVKSGELGGPAGTTPPGVTVGVDDVNALGFEATVQLGDGWAASLAGGLPPVVHLRAKGAGSALGRVGSARAWFPAALVSYTFNRSGSVRPFVAAGLNYTAFTSTEVLGNYTAAFQGTHSVVRPKSSFGPVIKLGVEVPLGERMMLLAGYSRYGIKTTADITTETPGVGPITRSITMRSDPGVVSLLVGYRF